MYQVCYKIDCRHMHAWVMHLCMFMLLISFVRVYVDLLSSDDDDFTLEDSAVQQAIEDSISPRSVFYIM